MPDLASPRHRVSFRLLPDVSRAGAADIAAGMLLREKPDGASIPSFCAFPPSEGGSEDPAVVTFMWEPQYELNDADGRHWNWGHVVKEALADKLRERLGDLAGT